MGPFYITKHMWGVSWGGLAGGVVGLIAGDGAGRAVDWVLGD